MQKQLLVGASILATLCFCLALRSAALAHNPTPHAVQKEAAMATHASGTFEVKITPQTADEIETAAGVGRMSIDKQIHGELEGTSKGEMLVAGTDVKGSAAYVALERVTGTLNGRSGTFVLQHTASMTSSSQQLLITVVPDSGTGQLIGLSGKFVIKIVDKKHFYEFEYSLPADN
jgi:Protein of unknown function (DUF3224)